MPVCPSFNKGICNEAVPSLLADLLPLLVEPGVGSGNGGGEGLLKTHIANSPRLIL